MPVVEKRLFLEKVKDFPESLVELCQGCVSVTAPVGAVAVTRPPAPTASQKHRLHGLDFRPRPLPKFLLFCSVLCCVLFKTPVRKFESLRKSRDDSVVSLFASSRGCL